MSSCVNFLLNVSRVRGPEVLVTKQSFLSYGKTLGALCVDSISPLSLHSGLAQVQKFAVYAALQTDEEPLCEPC